MKYEWVKQRKKALHHIWHALKIEQNELASRGITFIDYSKAQNAVQKLLDVVSALPVDPKPPRKKAPQKSEPEAQGAAGEQADRED